MQSYLNIVKKILAQGKAKPDRTGTGTIAIAGHMFQHDMASGFPLLTTKKVPYRLVASELEFFIKGITDKKWLQDRNNHIWDEWCTPLKVPYAHDEQTKKRMIEERDLGTIYGWEWRHFGAEYRDYNTDYTGQGVDQLKKLVDNIKREPTSRQMLVLAWNPLDIKKAVPPYCHYAFQVTVIDGRLNLFWNQRSVDVALGLPFNIASYATLLHLLALETGYKEGMLTGFLADVHIYLNHIEGLKEQLTRDPNKYPLPTIKTENFKSIFDWQYTDTVVENYQSYPSIKFQIAV
ncbi:thymidylate synthase [Candidatus Kuenenbacteria bacterium RIFCSPHIGHO2_02_FULL_39_13]|uniref:Thymidylate synthase n=1 Tax=Candidatus Kuenenbacteria bacterium RIFCSPHIGHO2_02_FULL_39_13 TaxID=1798561 RepID=A0A1F6FP39_9BACT|nr:MAG: thymidylate synthase [Candidatus Kuenenbacteria bacterium RIFCSPHIGHO2_02_FULL_39_13]